MSLAALAAISDLRARAAALDLRLRADVRGSAVALEALTRSAAAGDGRSRDVLLAFALLRATRDDPALFSALSAVASELPMVEPLFRTTSSARAIPRHARIEPMVPAFAYRALPHLRSAPLPIWLGATRERVLRDPRASVVAALLGGAPMELRDVLRIAARRPSSSDVAVAVASSRYLGELSVREALVRNPFTPGWLSLVLLPTVRTRLVDLSLAHEEVRAYARVLAPGCI